MRMPKYIYSTRDRHNYNIIIILILNIIIIKNYYILLFINKL
jgi:hypothetical protein